MFLATIPALSAPQGTGEQVISNYEIIEKISAEAIEELKANMPGIDRNKLVFLAKAKGSGDDIDFVFQNVMLKRLTDAGFRVSERRIELESGELMETPAFELNYQLISLNLKYPDISRSYWIGAKEVEREAEINVFSQLIDLSSGDIIWVGETQKRYEDRISYSLLEKVEDPQHDFTRPPRKELRWSTLIEPAIVTGIVTGLVYLFFANQSGD